MNTYPHSVYPARVITVDAEAFMLQLQASHEALFRRLRDEIQSAHPKQHTKLYHSREETAQMLNVSIPTLRRYVKEEGLMQVKVGNRVVFKADDIEQWLTQHKKQATGTP
jgi:excisionase family DNA binding protein